MSGTGEKTGKLSKALLWVAGAAIALVVLAWWSLVQPPRQDWRATDTGWWDWLKYPVEKNAFRRILTFEGGNRVFLHPDTRHAWAVGDGGSIQVTSDGGVTWQIRQSGTQNSLYCIQMSADTQKGWVVGANGTILTTHDGGMTWQLQARSTQEDLYDIHIKPDALHGWTVGNKGTVLATRDGGRTWLTQSSGTRETLWDVHTSSDALHGWAVGTNGTILATRDGGINWQIQSGGTRESLESVFAGGMDGHGWVVGSKGTILVTRDGGKTWRKQTSDTTETLFDIKMDARGGFGWAVGGNGTILATRDGGHLWHKQATSTNELLLAVQMGAIADQGWAMGDKGTVLTTHNGGATWDARDRSSPPWFRAVQMSIDDQQGWAVGDKGTILATRDGGTTWQAQASGTQDNLRAMQLNEATRLIWVVGDNGTILVTRDGGTTWKTQASGTREHLSSLHVGAGDRVIWVVGNNGTILVTRDGGVSWQARVSGTREDFVHIQMDADDRHGFVLGYNGALLATSDGGETWQAQSLGVQHYLYALHMGASPQQAWVVGWNGAILATRDGGKNWHTQDSGTRERLNDIQMEADGPNGWLVGVNGTILATRDGGSTWQRQISNTQRGLNALIIGTDSRKIWVVGHGAILKTSDGGEHWKTMRYSRYPAPWFWLLASLLLATSGYGVWRTMRPKVVGGIAGLSVSDDPIDTAEADRLGHLKIARALAAFLRNEGTRPPLVVAVEAAWGQGKSSLMNLLKGELEHSGVHCVWFNPWHHQQEPVLLAPLIDAIHREGFPSLWSRAGLFYRYRLLNKRATRRPVAAALVLVPALMMSLLFLYGLALLAASAWFQAVAVAGRAQAVGWLAPWLYLPEVVMQGMVSTLAGMLDSPLGQGLLGLDFGEIGKAFLGLAYSQPGVFSYLILSLLGGLLLWLLYGMFLQPFAQSPGVLLASLSGKASRAQVEDQTAFRNRFRLYFREAAEALLPRPLVIFIDDLDRCGPKQTLEMMEAVNFLTSNGPCVVVMGMARDIVEANLGEAMKETGDALAVTYGKGADGKQRGEHARNYLRKLVQLRVKVPRFDDAARRQIWQERVPTPFLVRLGMGLRRRGRLLATLFAPLLAAAMVVMFWQALPIWEKQVQSRHTDLEERFQKESRELRGDEQRQLTQVEALREMLEVKPVAKAMAINAATPKPGSPAAKALLKQADEALKRLNRATNIYLEILREPPGERQDEALRREEINLDLARTEIQVLAKQAGALLDPEETTVTAKPRKPAPDGKKAQTDSSKANEGEITTVWVPESLPIILILLGLPLYAWLSADRFKRKDSADFRKALEIWQDLFDLAPERQSPREFKRFLNLTRYAAARLNDAEPEPSWTGLLARKLGRLPVTAEKMDTGMNEAKVVMLSAVFHARPDEKVSLSDLLKTSLQDLLTNEILPASAETDGSFTGRVRMLRKKSTLQLAPTNDEIRRFEQALGEFAESGGPGAEKLS